MSRFFHPRTVKLTKMHSQLATFGFVLVFGSHLVRSTPPGTSSRNVGASLSHLPPGVLIAVAIQPPLAPRTGPRVSCVVLRPCSTGVNARAPMGPSSLMTPRLPRPSLSFLLLIPRCWHGSDTVSGFGIVSSPMARASDDASSRLRTKSWAVPRSRRRSSLRR